MSERLKECIADDLEITLDFFTNTSVQNVFFGELADRRAELVESLIDTGKDEDRFRIKMLDEVFGIAEEIQEELKTRKSEEQ